MFIKSSRSADSAKRQEVISAILTRHAAAGDDTEALAEASMNMWREIAFQLGPIIGEGGVGSLYARSLHLTSARFPWLAAVQTGLKGRAQQTDWPFMDLRASLESHTPAEIGAASSAHLVAFIELLASLIGDSLTARLLRSLWADANASKSTEIRE